VNHHGKDGKENGDIKDGILHSDMPLPVVTQSSDLILTLENT